MSAYQRNMGDNKCLDITRGKNMGRYDDWGDAHAAIDANREFLRDLSDEKFAAYYINQQIIDSKEKIKFEKENLEELKKIANKLPRPPKTKSYINRHLLAEFDYRWRNFKQLVCNNENN